MSEGDEKGGRKSDVTRGFLQRRMQQIEMEKRALKGARHEDRDKISQLPLPEDNLKLLAIRNARKIVQEFNRLGMTDVDQVTKEDSRHINNNVLYLDLAKHRGPISKTDKFLFTIALEYIRRVESGGDI
ncbi:MAG: hypothetical protein Q7S75_03890 [bacterium]|nr:hypothetical protein [bacterium]